MEALWAVATLRWEPSLPWMHAALASLSTKVHHLRAPEVAITAWALSRLRCVRARAACVACCVRVPASVRRQRWRWGAAHAGTSCARQERLWWGEVGLFALGCSCLGAPRGQWLQRQARALGLGELLPFVGGLNSAAGAHVQAAQGGAGAHHLGAHVRKQPRVVLEPITLAHTCASSPG